LFDPEENKGRPRTSHIDENCVIVESVISEDWRQKQLATAIVHYVRHEALTAVVMNVAVFWGIATCSPYMPCHLL
jgi:hypothetical protein